MAGLLQSSGVGPIMHLKMVRLEKGRIASLHTNNELLLGR
jgi:hypothetical protein